MEILSENEESALTLLHQRKRENKLKNFQRNKFNIDQMFSNYLFIFFAVCVYDDTI